MIIPGGTFLLHRAILSVMHGLLPSTRRFQSCSTYESLLERKRQEKNKKKNIKKFQDEQHSGTLDDRPRSSPNAKCCQLVLRVLE